MAHRNRQEHKNDGAPDSRPDTVVRADEWNVEIVGTEIPDSKDRLRGAIEIILAAAKRPDVS